MASIWRWARAKLNGQPHRAAIAAKQHQPLAGEAPGEAFFHRIVAHPPRRIGDYAGHSMQEAEKVALSPGKTSRHDIRLNPAPRRRPVPAAGPCLDATAAAAGAAARLCGTAPEPHPGRTPAPERPAPESQGNSAYNFPFSPTFSPPMVDKYQPAEIERAAQEHWAKTSNYTIGDVLSRFHTMRATTCCNRWVGTPSACPPKTPPWPTTCRRPPGPTKHRVHEAAAQVASASPSTGTRTGHLHPQYLPLGAVAVHPPLRKGPGLSKKLGTVNWDPVDHTVLANEQVIDGRGWRSGALVEKREIPMYYMKITAYAEELLAELDNLPGWPEQVRLMQKNWIGKSTGVRFAFPLADEFASTGRKSCGCSPPAPTPSWASPSSPSPPSIRWPPAPRNNPELAAFIEECKRVGVAEADIGDDGKEGHADRHHRHHPLTGEQVEVWVGNHVLMSYGDGAVMAVPAHDERDFAFAKKYNLPIKQVIAAEGETFSLDGWQEWYGDKTKGICINSGKYDGLGYEPRSTPSPPTSPPRAWATRRSSSACATGAFPPALLGLPDPDHPLRHLRRRAGARRPVARRAAPENVEITGAGSPPWPRCPSSTRMTCPKWRRRPRETDTMDTFVESSWYFLRYACPDNATAMVDERVAYWCKGAGVDQYIGGIEHAILHLLYSRFFTKLMRDVG